MLKEMFCFRLGAWHRCIYFRNNSRIHRTKARPEGEFVYKFQTRPKIFFNFFWSNEKLLCIVIIIIHSFGVGNDNFKFFQDKVGDKLCFGGGVIPYS